MRFTSNSVSEWFTGWELGTSAFPHQIPDPATRNKEALDVVQARVATQDAAGATVPPGEEHGGVMGHTLGGFAVHGAIYNFWAHSRQQLPCRSHPWTASVVRCCACSLKPRAVPSGMNVTPASLPRPLC